MSITGAGACVRVVRGQLGRDYPSRLTLEVVLVLGPLARVASATAVAPG
jgi:hypothetical protein